MNGRHKRPLVYECCLKCTGPREPKTRSVFSLDTSSTLNDDIDAGIGIDQPCSSSY